MFFTQDDYKKIREWLIRNSIRDTEFNEAVMPFKGNETIAFVQDGHNVKVYLKDFIKKLNLLGVHDFINITEASGESHINLEDAIKLVPYKARKSGQVITFLDTEGNWKLYQFKGVRNQWNVLDQWEDLFLIVNSILPDEEDLTKSPVDKNGNSYLSLKDKEYKPEDFSGLGRVILRKNIVEVENPIYGKVKKNYLYQDMINKSNTIYEIRYDFDLNGKEITIPEGCVLDFQGGSFNNGTIKGNNCKVCNKNNNIFINCSLYDFDVYEWDIKWFGSKEGEDIADIIQHWYDNVYLNHIYTSLIINGKYLISKTINVKYGIKIKSVGDSYPHASETNFFPKEQNLKIGATLEVVPGITAFNISDFTLSDPRWGKIGQIQLENIRFISTEYTSTLCDYKASGNPDRKFYIKDCLFKGFDKVLYFEGATAPVGSIASTFRIEHSRFEQNNYSIYAKMLNSSLEDGTEIKPITFHALIISRCSFIGEKDDNGNYIHFPKLYLSALYGQSRIEYCSFERADEKSPIYCGLYWGNIVFEGNYIENYRGKIHFARESASDDNSVVEINANYGNWSYGTHNYFFDNVIVNTLQKNLWDFNVRAKYPIIHTKDLSFNCGSMKWTYIDASEDDNTRKCCILDVPETFEIQKAHGKTVTINGVFSMDNLLCINSKRNIYGTVLKGDDIAEFKYKLIRDVFSSGTYVLALYKSIGNLKIDLCDGDTVIKTIYTNRSQGLHLFYFASNSINNAIIKIKKLGLLNMETYVSEITAFKVSTSIKEYNTIGVYNWLGVGNRCYGTTSQKPTLLLKKGFQYFDTTLNKPIWWTGEKWVDAAGANVDEVSESTVIEDTE